MAEQWASLEREVRASIAQLPNVDPFTEADIERILNRVREVNAEAINAVPLPLDVDGDTLEKIIRPVYSILIGEIVALCCEITLMDKVRR